MPIKPFKVWRQRILPFGMGVALVVTPMPFLAMSAMAFDASSKAAVNVDASGLALRGYDPVAYFTVGQAMVGDPRFTAKLDGATYRFASAANREAFLKNPAKYVPAYGGFCIWRFGRPQG